MTTTLELQHVPEISKLLSRTLYSYLRNTGDINNKAIEEILQAGLEGWVESRVKKANQVQEYIDEHPADSVYGC